MSKTRRSVVRIGWVGLLLLTLAGARAEGQLAVIVHPDVPVEDVSLEDLRRWYTGQVTSFEDGRRIQLIRNRALEEKFYEVLLDWSPKRYTQHWIGVVLSGGSGSPPVDPGRDGVATVVARNPRALSFVSVDKLDRSVKVLRVEGRLPGEAGYPLR